MSDAIRKIFSTVVIVLGVMFAVSLWNKARKDAGKDPVLQ